MSLTTIDDSEKEPVHFRIRSVGPNPVPQAVAHGEVFLIEVDYVRMAGAPGNLGCSAAQLGPYREALQEAVDSQAVYWVDLSFPEPDFIPAKHDTALDRLLRAVRNRQLVDSGAAPDVED